MSDEQMRDEFKEMAERFCSWPLPSSACADGVACLPGIPDRTGTNLLTVAEAEQMAKYVVKPCIAKYTARIAELEQENAKLRSDRLATQESLQILARAEKAEAERDWAYGAFKRLAVNVCEMDSDNRNGDFALTKLARLDLDACVECCSDLPEAFQNWTGAPVVTRRELIAERDRLRAAIERAPHTSMCKILGGDEKDLCC